MPNDGEESQDMLAGSPFLGLKGETMKYRYYHLRIFDEKGHPSPFGGATICYDRDRDRYHIAYCSLKDRFCKRIGREIARGRLESSTGLLPYEMPTRPRKLQKLGLPSPTSFIRERKIDECDSLCNT